MPPYRARLCRLIFAAAAVCLGRTLPAAEGALPAPEVETWPG